MFACSPSISSVGILESSPLCAVMTYPRMNLPGMIKALFWQNTTNKCVSLSLSLSLSLSRSRSRSRSRSLALALALALSLFLTLFPWVQYSYDGMEMSSLPVDLMVIWNGDFSIDNPAQNKGEASDPAVLQVPLDLVSIATDLQHPPPDILMELTADSLCFCLTSSSSLYFCLFKPFLPC